MEILLKQLFPLLNDCFDNTIAIYGENPLQIHVNKPVGRNPCGALPTTDPEDGRLIADACDTPGLAKPPSSSYSTITDFFAVQKRSQIKIIGEEFVQYI